MVDNKFFRDMVRTLKGKASIPSRRVLLARMEELLVDLQGSVGTMLRGQYVSMTTDGWTSRASESYISFTAVYVNDDWKMVTLALSCSKKQGSTKGEDLAASIDAMVETHGLTGHVVVGNTDCEPSMVKAGRILTEKGVLMHAGCTWYRIKCVTALVFDGPGVKKSMALARAVVTRYTKSSQAARVLLLPCVEALAKDFDSRFGNGSNILTFREAPRRQPRGFRKVQIMATALDPRCKMLYGILPNEHEGVWQAVAMAAADIVKSTQVSVGATASSAAGSTPGGPGLGASARPASKRFCSGFMAAFQAQATSASTATAAPSLPAENFLKEAKSEVTRYRAASGLAMEVAQESGKILYPDPLDWWRINAVKLPLVAALARRLLAIPAWQAQSEPVFSSAGQVVTQTRNRLSSENVELLVALKNIWSVVEEWQQSKATPV